MKNITYIFMVSQYYPYYSAIGRCISNVIEAISKESKVIVLSTKQSDEELNEERVSENTTILRMTSQYTLKTNRLQKKAKESLGLKRQINQLVYRLSKVPHYVKAIVKPDSLDKKSVSAICQALKNAIGSTPIDSVVLLPTCTPFTYVYACAQFKLQNPQLCFIPYLFDEFSNNISLCRGRLIKSIKYKRNVSIEKEAFDAADYIIHMPVWTKHIDLMLTAYKRKCHQVEHPLLMLEKSVIEHKKDNCIHILYAGVVDTRIRNPNKALRIAERIVGINDNTVIDFYSYGTAESQIENSAKKYKGRIVAHGRVDGAFIDQKMREADILLSIGNNATDQIPSKIFEYMSYGHPILHISTSKHDRCEKVLAKYPLSVVFRIDDDENELKKIEAILAMVGKRSNYQELIENYRNAIPRTTVDIIIRLVNQYRVNENGTAL